MKHPETHPAKRAVLRHSFVIGFNKQIFGTDEQVSGTWSNLAKGRLARRRCERSKDQ